MSNPFADMAALSRLLDEAIDLPSADVPLWLDRLPPDHAHLRGRLQAMLVQHAATKRASALDQGPVLPDDPAIGREGEQIGPYVLLREIGKGGMGSVWLAERTDGLLKRRIALKLPRLAWDAGLAERMARERDIAALLAHPNIARLYDAGVDHQGRPYLAFEFVEGEHIDRWCESHQLGVRERLRLFVQVARAVAYAHGRLIVHRDLKPANVVVTQDGQTHLLDFGIAKLLHDATPGDSALTREQGRALTPRYASPEQIRGDTITVRSDVFSLGALLYELLTGRTPYRPTRNTLAAMEEAVLEGEPALASSTADGAAARKLLRGEIDAILTKALRRDPESRYPTADALSDDVDRYLSGERVLARGDSLWYRARKSLHRNRLAFGAGTAVVLVLLAGAGVAVIQATKTARLANQQVQVTQFVADVFRISYRSGSADTPASGLTGEQLTQDGVHLIEARFPNAPAMQAQLYGVVGRMFADMGAGRQAVDYTSHQVQALDEAATTSDELPRALIRLADALIDSGRLRDAEAPARRALLLTVANPGQHADALVAMARSLIGRQKNEEAARVVQELESMGNATGRATIAQAWVSCLRATLAQAETRTWPLQEPLRARCVADAVRAEGPSSRDVIRMQLVYATSLIRFGHLKEAKQTSDAALQAARDQGGPSAIFAATQSAVFARTYGSEGLMGHAEVLAEIGRSQRYLALNPEVPKDMRAMADFERGVYELFRTDLVEANKWMRKSAPIIMGATDHAGVRYNVLNYMFLLAIESGRPDEATGIHEEMVRTRVGSKVFAHEYVSRHAGMFMMSGDYASALRVLDEAPAFSGRAAQWLAWMRGEVLVESGDAEKAWAAVEKLKLLPVTAATEPTYRVMAAAQCGRGHATEGLKLFKLAMGPLEKFEAPSSPLLARVRAQIGLCRLSLGEVQAARALSQRAHAAFEQQPDVSPYYKRPLIELDQQLARVGGVRSRKNAR